MLIFQKKIKILEKIIVNQKVSLFSTLFLIFPFILSSLLPLPLFSSKPEKRVKGTNQPFLNSREVMAERKERRPEHWNKNVVVSLEKV